MKNKRINKLTKMQYVSLISLVVIVFSLPFLIPLFKLLLSIDTNANLNTVPQEVIISNITSNSANISWYTNEETEGYIKYGTSLDALNFLGSDIEDVGNDNVSKYKTHIIKLDNLSPTTQYFFKIYSNGEEFSDVDIMKFTTFPIDENVALPKTLKGKLDKEIKYALVYVFASNGRSTSEIRSTYTSSNGTFTYDISALKTFDGTSEFPLENAKLVTYVNAVDQGRARIIHNADEDPGVIFLDTQSNMAFDLDVDVFPASSEEVSSNDNQKQVDNSNNIQSSTPQDVGETYGIDLAKEMFTSNLADKNPVIPTNIFVSNISQTNFTVNWTTKQPTSGYIVYGNSPYNLKNKALDIRDSDASVKRYTHSVSIVDSTRKAGDKIYFKIVSKGKSYGQNNRNLAYKFIAPESLNSPPSPSVLNGNLDLLSGSRLSTNLRDYIIFTKVVDDNNNSSIYISTVPAYNSNGWSLSIGSALGYDLNSIISFSKANINVLGEYNSSNSKEILSISDVVNLRLVPGLTVLSPEIGEKYSTLNKIYGTANPNTTVSIKLNNNNFSAIADNYGDWEIPVTDIAQGYYNLDVSDSSSVLGLSFSVNLSQLPITSIKKGDLLILAGFIILGLGIYSVFYVRKNKFISD